MGVFALLIVLFALAGGGPSKDDRPSTLGTAGADAPGLGGAVTALDQGDPFPSFDLTEAGGRRLTNGSIAGKPAIVWFTTSYCVPCQLGAQAVAQLDDQLGGEAFEVLVVFVDPSEPRSALIEWRKRFANEDWLVALDDGLSQQVGLHYLDTKFLLDEGGIIRDVDVVQVDRGYIDLVRAEVTT